MMAVAFVPVSAYVAEEKAAVPSSFDRWKTAVLELNATSSLQ